MHLEGKDGMQCWVMEFLYRVSNWSRKGWLILNQGKMNCLLSVGWLWGKGITVCVFRDLFFCVMSEAYACGNECVRF